MLFLASQAVSLFGSALVQYALLWHITMTTQSGEMMTVAILVGFLPMLVLAPFGGVWADRHNRRYLIAGADALVASSTAALLICLLLGIRDLWLIFLVLGIRAIGGGIQQPAVAALLPQIVPTEHLGKVNGYNASIQAAVSLLSPMLAGAILSVAPMEWVLSIDIVTAATAIAILLLAVRTPAHAKALAAERGSPLQDLRLGVRYVADHPLVRRLFRYFGITYLLASPVAFLTPLQVTRTFSNEVWRLTVIEMTFSIGMLIGGIVIANWGGFRRRTTTIAVAIALLGLMTVLLGLPQSFVLYNVWMFSAGLFMPWMSTPTTTLLQERVEQAYLGRVFSVMTMIATSTMPVGMLFFGPLADRTSVETILLATGALMLVGGALMLRDPVLARDDQPAPKPAHPATAPDPGDESQSR